MTDIEQQLTPLRVVFQPAANVVRADNSFIPDQAGEALPARFLGGLLANLALPGLGENARHLVTEFQRLEQLPLAVIQPGFITTTAQIQAVAVGAADLEFTHQLGAFWAAQRLLTLAGRHSFNLRLWLIILRLTLSPIAVIQQGHQGARTLWAAVGQQAVIQLGWLQRGGTTGRTLHGNSFSGWSARTLKQLLNGDKPSTKNCAAIG